MKAPNKEDEPKNNSVKIAAKGKQTLTKNQQLFNKLTKKIEELEIDIEESKKRLTDLLDEYGKKITPKKTEIANANIKLAMAIAGTKNDYKYSKAQYDKLRRAILLLCDEAFQLTQPSPEQEAFYDEWAETSYHEEIEIQQKDAAEQFAAYANFHFGIDIDPEIFEGTPEDFARIQEEIKAKIEQRQRKNRTKERKKTKKQLEKEELLKAEETIKAKSIRSIYIALAKVLHPDAETNIELKVEKEEIMKQVTVAYENKDLLTLLKLEMEWVKKTTEHLDEMADETLKIFNTALNQQVEELIQERLAMLHSPHFRPIARYTHMKEKTAKNLINKEAKELHKVSENLDTIRSMIVLESNKKEILSIIEEYVLVNEEDDDINLDQLFSTLDGWD